MLSLVSTWMGDRLGIPGAVDLLFSFCLFYSSISLEHQVYSRPRKGLLYLWPYHIESTGSRPITEVKQRRARLVLGWVTAWEYRVP